MDAVSVVESLERLGGVATRATLIAATDRIRVDRALEVGDIVVLARGRYALPEIDASRAAAHRLTGAVSWRSAAQLWGWELLRTAGPTRGDGSPQPQADERTTCWGHGPRGDLHSSEIDDGVATKARTLSDCLRGLPFDEALAVADSAVRHGFSARLLKGLAASARGPGSAQFRRVARIATADAVNPFESGLQAIADGVARTPRQAAGVHL